MENSISVQSGMTLYALGIFSKTIFSLEETMMLFGIKSNDYHGDKIIRCGGFYCALAKTRLSLVNPI